MDRANGLTKSHVPSIANSNYFLLILILQEIYRLKFDIKRFVEFLNFPEREAKREREKY